MAAVKVYRGDTWRRIWIVQDAHGAPLDLTGYTARLHVRDADGLKLAEASTADGRLVITPAAGRIELTMPAAVMAGLAPGSVRFDIELTSGGGEVTTLEQSTLVVREDMARD